MTSPILPKKPILFNFNNNELQVILLDNLEPWFIAKEISDLLGYSETSKMLKRLDDDEKKTVARNDQLIPLHLFKNQGNLILINQKGVLQAISGSYKKTQSFKKELLNLIGISNLYIVETKESLFAESLIDFVKEAYKLHIQTQFYILGYKIDFYLPEIKLAIEFDEEHHKYTEEDDLTREHLISKALDCSFLRIPHKLSLSLQLALVTKAINQRICSS